MTEAAFELGKRIADRLKREGFELGDWPENLKTFCAPSPYIEVVRKPLGKKAVGIYRWLPWYKNAERFAFAKMDSNGLTPQSLITFSTIDDHGITHNKVSVTAERYAQKTNGGGIWSPLKHFVPNG